jgi:hypothetical protein
LNCAGTTVSKVGTVLTINWRFTPKAKWAGTTRNLYLFVRDKANQSDGFEQFGTWQIKGGPTNLSVTPNSGSSATGTERTLTTRHSDPDGAGDISFAYVRINATNSGTNALWAYYNAVANKLYLRNDADTAWVGGFAPGSNNTISNAQGRLHCAATSVAAAGDVLTINWRFSPSTGFTGTKKLFLFVQDKNNLKDGWDEMGTWTITAPPS